MKRTLTISLDTDWIWRVVFFKAAEITSNSFAKAGAAISVYVRERLGAIRKRAEWRLGSISKNRHGVFARAWPIGVTALWIAVLLTAYIGVYLL